MTLPVYVDTSLAEVTVGQLLHLNGGEGRHAVTVRRTRVGEHIDIVNGRGLRATVEVTATAKDSLSGVVRDVVAEPASGVKICLVQALAKGGRDDQAIETATEYGVDDIIPWQANRCVVKWNGAEKTAKAVAKWQATAETAAKQSRRSWIPQVSPALDSRALADYISRAKDRAERVYICHETASEPLTTHLYHDVAQAPERITVVVGPEGGISAEEIASSVDAGGIVVGLGKHVLRSATAGPWAVAVIRAILGQ